MYQKHSSAVVIYVYVTVSQTAKPTGTLYSSIITNMKKKQKQKTNDSDDVLGGLLTVNTLRNEFCNTCCVYF